MSMKVYEEMLLLTGIESNDSLNGGNHIYPSGVRKS